MESYFVTKTLPMIKIETIENQPFDDGIDVIRAIVEKRANLELFETDVLERLIRYTGGSLRDLFHVINASAKRADRRDSEIITMDDAERALEELKTSLTRQIEDKEMLLKMLQASVVLEYNGKRWHNVHPEKQKNCIKKACGLKKRYWERTIQIPPVVIIIWQGCMRGKGRMNWHYLII